jgi:hypothetical protein
MGDEEVGEEGEESDHYESMVFNLLTGNTQGYQVCTKKSLCQNFFQPLFFSLLRGKLLKIGLVAPITVGSDTFLLNSDLEFS